VGRELAEVVRQRRHPHPRRLWAHGNFNPVIGVNTPVNHRIEPWARFLPNLEVRIAEDGEILVRRAFRIQRILEPTGGNEKRI